jgi:cytochrome c5
MLKKFVWLFLGISMILLPLLAVSCFYSGLDSTPTLPPPPPSSLVITPVKPANLAVGSTLQFSAIWSYSGSSNPGITSPVTWTSSDATVATISSSGLATGVGSGTATITASLLGITSPAVTLTVTASIVAPTTTVTATPAQANSHPSTTVPPTAAGGPPLIPADHVGRTACFVCHKSGVGPPLPTNPDHSNFTDSLQFCQACHQGPGASTPAASAPAASSSPASAINAASIYASSCAACHGANRQGSVGPALNASTLGAISSADLASEIANGKTGTAMPSFSSQLSTAQINALVAFIMQP